MSNKDADIFSQYFERKPASAKIGLFCVGLEAYWPQFPKLRDRLMEYHRELGERWRAEGHNVVDAGMCDSPSAARRAGEKLRSACVDLLVCNVVTYSPAANALPVARAVGRPILLVALQPDSALDYARAATYDQLANDNVTSLPEIAYTLRRAHLEAADILVGRLHADPRAEARLHEWGRIAAALRALRGARIGSMGHIYEGMLDMNCDPTALEAAFGLHVEHLELDDLQRRVEGVSEEATDRRMELIRHLFYFAPPGGDPLAGEVDPDELRWAARVSIGLESLVQDFDLTGLAYYYRGWAGNANERLASNLIIGASLLTGRGTPVAGELDVKTCLAMLILDRLGAGGSFAELHPVDFDGDFVLVGHDGPHHVGIAEGRPILRGLRLLHGKRGRGPSVEFAIRHGPITLLALTQIAEGRFAFVTAEGESLEGPIPATGNTNTRARFPPDVRSFIEAWSAEGPTHHFALGVGHCADSIRRLARALDIEFRDVTAGA